MAKKTGARGGAGPKKVTRSETRIGRASSPKLRSRKGGAASEEVAATPAVSTSRTAAQAFRSHPWHGVSPGAEAPDIVTAYIEIVPQDSVKYEVDKESGILRLDRPQRFSNQCPTLYGFIPMTYCDAEVAARAAQRTGNRNIRGDGDPLDICVLTEKVIPHGNFLLRARAVGGLRMIDAQEADDKIIAVLENDLAYGHVRDLFQCPPALIERLEHYFLTYKQLPGEGVRRVEIAERYDAAEAREVITRSLRDYQNSYGEPG